MSKCSCIKKTKKTIHNVYIYVYVSEIESGAERSEEFNRELGNAIYIHLHTFLFICI